MEVTDVNGLHLFNNGVFPTFHPSCPVWAQAVYVLHTHAVLSEFPSSVTLSVQPVHMLCYHDVHDVVPG